MQRAALQAALSCVRGAITSKAVAPAFGAVFFDGHSATVFNGELAITAPCESPMWGGIDCKLLDEWVSSCKGDEIEFSGPAEVGRDDVYHLKCGRSKLSVSTIDISQLVFKHPGGAGIEIRDVDELLGAISRAAPFMGNDQAHPSLIGITLAFDDGVVHVYATDSVTLSKETVTAYCDEDLTVMLSPRFVKELMAMQSRGEVTSMEFGDDWVSAAFQTDEVEETVLFARTGADADERKYEGIIKRVSEELELDEAVELPEDLADVVRSATAVMGTFGENYCRLQMKDGELTVEAGNGSVEFRESIETEHWNGSVTVDGKGLLRVLAGGGSFIASRDALVCVSKSSVRMVAAASDD